ncbi:MAG TPA: FG-GAP-like repeat-containing protein [Pyrinomonadaceae bacterium]|nr:FG-GAP-like repeat-containing protein [Pyrinomonadaceae bacterium]
MTVTAFLNSAAPSRPNAAAQDDKARAREDAYRANNLGVAMLEQFKPKDAAEQFRRALKLDPGVALARINLAVALFNVPDVDAAAAEAEAATKAAPGAPQPHYILGLIAKQQGRTEDALASFRRVLATDPRDVGANVQTGQLLAQQRKYEEAAGAFRVALEEEPYNGTALYNLGTVLTRSGRGEQGKATLQRFQALRASGAATVVGQNYLEQGRYAEAVVSTGAEPDVVDRRTPEVTFVDATAQAFAPPKATAPRGRASRARGSRGSGRARRDAGVGGWDVAAVKSQLVASLGGGETLLDYDGDGNLDLFARAGDVWKLRRNDRGRFTDVTAQSGALAKAAGLAAVAGDFDNDERPDLFVFGAGSCALYRNEGGGKFSDATAAAKIPAYAYVSRSAAFVDYDHDGDLDIFVAGLADASKMNVAPAFGSDMPNSPDGTPGSKKLETVFDLARDLPGAPNLLLRNNGDGTFADVTAGAKLSGVGHASAVVPTDYDNRRDVDLLVVNYGAPPNLFRNMRDGTFRDVAADVGLTAAGDFKGAAAGDFNKDGFTDFYFAAERSAGLFAASDGRGRFRTSPAPAPLEGSTAAQFIDYDDDGLLDLLAASANGLRVLRNVGDGWTDATAASASSARISARSLVSADLDHDGDTDLLARDASGSPVLLRNDGGNRNRSLRVALAGKASNRGGVEAKIEIRAGSLQQKLETYAATPAPAPADVVFGLGQRKSADAVRVLWPSGVVQAETESPATSVGNETATGVRPGSLRVTELDRKPSSCPYLYTWNGRAFEFITDFMGGGETGDWVAPGIFNTPDPDEYVRIRGDQLRERDGRYELRVTNELEEALFVDRLQLVAVSHPMGVEVYPNEGLGNPTGPAFKLYATRGARAPRAATDEHGRDVLPRLARLDRKYVDDFALHGVRGYAAEHTLTLDLSREGSAFRVSSAGKNRARNPEPKTLLLLTGWTDYAFSSNNVAASQRGMEMKPPALQVRDGAGKWRTVIESLGFPVGRPQTVTVDLTGKFLSESREVRIVTSMRVYWDQALVYDAGEDLPVRVERLEASGATLRERGFSAEVTPDGREPFSYDYARVSLSSPWKAFVGRYTRPGDVRELLTKTDDMFVVSKPGDELALSFDASALAPLPSGWTRTFLLYADGFSKEMDINSASPHAVAPMPFHGMKRYPYDASQSYPYDAEHVEYLERYNTRVVASPLPKLSAAGR